jgi:TrkA domain protein
MPDVRETLLPGVGVRHEFTTVTGERVALLTHRGGRRELAVFDREDPDACTTVLHLSPDDTRTLAELLGMSKVTEAVLAVQQAVEGLTIDWLPMAPGTRFVGATIGDGRFRTETGASIVAVVRGETTIAAPGPELRFEAGDVLVAVGTAEGLSRLHDLLAS